MTDTTAPVLKGRADIKLPLIMGRWYQGTFWFEPITEVTVPARSFHSISAGALVYVPVFPPASKRPDRGEASGTQVPQVRLEFALIPFGAGGVPVARPADIASMSLLERAFGNDPGLVSQTNMTPKQFRDSLRRSMRHGLWRPGIWL